MNSNLFASLLVAAAASFMLTTSAAAHDDAAAAHDAKVARVNPATLVQLDDVRETTARYLEVDAAVADGYGWRRLCDSSIFTSLHRDSRYTRSFSAPALESFHASAW